MKQKHMAQSGRNREKCGICFFLTLFLCFSIGFQFCVHHWDNKYTYNEQEQPVCGVLPLSEEALNAQAYYICNDWEFYSGVLLSPADFQKEALFPDAYVRLGQYAGFELDNREGKPHGSATYRVRILLPEQKGRYTLELPEIFSAYRLWINGEAAFRSGNPEPDAYEPQVEQTKISFEAAGEAELVFAVSDYSHYYSGMVYPPAFGTEQQVNRLLSGRLAMKSIQCFFALLIFLCYTALYLGQRQNRRKLYMALTCLGYLGYAGYLLVHTFLPTGHFFWYRLEDFSMMFMLFFLCRLVGGMWEDQYSSGAGKCMTAAGLSAMAASLIIPGFLSEGGLPLMLFYGGLMDVYKLAVVGYLLFHCTIMLWKRRDNSLPVLCGLLFFGTGLAADRLDTVYEPVLLGWGAEYGGFFLIGVLAAMMVKESLWAQKWNRQLLESDQRKAKHMEEVVHDLKSPLATITTYAELSQMGIAEEPEQQQEFLAEIQARARELAERIGKLRYLDDGAPLLKLCPVDSLVYLREIGEKYSLLLAQKGLDIQVGGESFMVSIDREQMGLALENLIMNAMRYTQPGGYIRLAARIRGGKKELVVSDTGAGVDAAYLNSIFHRGVTGERSDHSGLGLYIVSRVAQAHHGTVMVESEQGAGSSFILQLE